MNYCIVGQGFTDGMDFYGNPLFSSHTGFNVVYNEVIAKLENRITYIPVRV